MTKTGLRKKLSPEKADQRRTELNIYEWNKPAQYEYVKQLKGDRLRWEFLRRDEAYRAKYQKRHLEVPHPILGAYIDPKKRGDELAENFRFLDTARRGEPLVLRPPSVKTLLFKREEISADNKIHTHYGYELNELHELGYVVMVFDPARAPYAQTRAAFKILKARHAEHAEQYPQHTIKGKHAPKDAVKLLRTLDAALVGINNQNIGADIFGVEEYDHQIATGHERLKAAMGYWRVM